MLSILTIDADEAAKGEEMLPNDPDMLISVLNMKLRDMYKDLDDLCDDMDEDRDEIITRAEKAGYHYNEGKNRFV